MEIRESGRSTDFISPSFGYGCLLDCSYCYMKRHTDSNNLSISKNVGDILTAINNHVMWLPEKVPNQTHKEYYTYDIACNEDFALHSKHHKWNDIFDFFKNHDKIFASFATKIIPTDFLDYNPEKKIRIRFSLMPQRLSSILEPNTPQIIERIKAINLFKKAGYSVHINFSPIVVYQGWLEDYEFLFKQIDYHVFDKEDVLSECIFLTHNEKKHIDNLNAKRGGEGMLWVPQIQEVKTSQFGGKNVRYKRELKSKWIEEFKQLHNSIIPWNTIRYIF